MMAGLPPRIIAAVVPMPPCVTTAAHSGKSLMWFAFSVKKMAGLPAAPVWQ